MNALPCIASRDADRHASERGNEEYREQAITDRVNQLKPEMWQDLECLSDAANDCMSVIANYRRRKSCHPDAQKFLELLRDGTDDAELARLFRVAAKDSVADTADLLAKKEFGDV